MFIDPDDRHIGVVKADVCIVGGGAAGITLAAELAESELQVVVLETGGVSPTDDSRSVYRVLPGSAMKLGEDKTKPFYFGGNTNYWFGNCRPLDREDFEQRDWLPHSGWPIGLDELTPYYERAQHIAGLSDFRWYDIEASQSRLRHQPVNVSDAILETRLVQTTPVFSFADLHQEELAKAGNVQVLLGTHATSLKTNDACDRVVAVETVDSDGRRSLIEADTVVIASGGVENARLLLSSNETVAAGLGNDHDLVGRCFMEHFFFEFTSEQSGMADSKYRRDLHLYSSGVGDRTSQLNGRKGVADANIWGQLVLSDEFMRKEQVPALSLWVRPSSQMPPSLQILRSLVTALRERRLPQNPLSDLRAAFRDPVGAVRFLVWKLTGRGTPSKTYELRVQLEQSPDPENRIRLSSELDEFGQPRAEVSLRIDDEQRRAHARSLKIAADELGLKGDELAQELERKLSTGDFDFFWHHMGTTRMSSDPATGVVDRDCRVHGLSNLFVAGSSVFPTGGTAAPTLTVVALAVRLADHIRDRGTRTTPKVLQAVVS